MARYEFPKNFWWGSAASGPQTEGRIEGDGKSDNIFDYWYSIEPNKFFNKIGPGNASKVYVNYKEDIQLMKKTGHNSFRTSIQWSRLIPNGTGEINQKAVDFYNDFFQELKNNGIEPFVNLYHFDIPMALQKIGGWLNRENVDAYVQYAKTCFNLFGDKVKFWFTHNEPIVPAEGGYLYGFHYPVKTNHLKEAIQVGYNEILASALAIKEYKNLNLDGKIGIILNLSPSYPRDENNKEDVKAAEISDAFFNRSFLDPCVKGYFPKDLIEIIKDRDIMPYILNDDLDIIKNNVIDILGINYYQPRRVKAKESPCIKTNMPMPEDYFDNYDMPGKKMNPYRGWEIYEKGIYDLLINVKDNYNNIPCYISENGMGVENESRFIKDDGMIHDDYRIDFIKDHLKYVHKAIKEGSNCLGYHMWTCMDNWSWINAYKNRYGFISVDIDNNFKRSIKKSGYWFNKVSNDNGFED